ncbi:triosephosphate isomerase [Sphingomonas insulae]|uniref:triose-phosphate isomerase n=1 Tax=Sphingomonas insulae TaxID=424800 RepID=UPI00308449F5|nr:triosephosphate isomerase [Sphingomonas insulae]
MIVGNWKMHGDGAWLDRVAAIAGAVAVPQIDVALCVPATLIHRAATIAPGLTIGAQDCHWAATGAHTGAISAMMLREAGAQVMILGHSERRAAGDDDAHVAAKVAAAQNAGLRVILCVGESAAERDDGAATARVRAQLIASLPERLTAGLTIAYEPIWAIGRGVIPSPVEITSVVDGIRSVLTARNVANARVLYGGSVTAAATRDLLARTDIDGLLVGAASLKPATFSEIIGAAIGLTNLDRPKPRL